MSQPLNRTCTHANRGTTDIEAGELEVGDPWQLVTNGENLSAYERNRMYLNVDGHHFVDGSFAGAADLDSDSRSVIATDFNDDGSIDLLVTSVGGGPLRMFHNSMPQQQRLRVKLEGVVSNRLGIGARVIARCGKRQFVRDVFPVNGFQGQAPATVDLAVGDAETIDQLSVRWPTGKVQVIENVSVREPLHLIESDD